MQQTIYRRLSINKPTTRKEVTSVPKLEPIDMQKHIETADAIKVLHSQGIHMKNDKICDGHHLNEEDEIRRNMTDKAQEYQEQAKDITREIQNDRIEPDSDVTASIEKLAASNLVAKALLQEMHQEDEITGQDQQEAAPTPQQQSNSEQENLEAILNSPLFQFIQNELPKVLNNLVFDFPETLVLDFPKTPKVSSVAENGLSVENIRKAGHRISVHHYRAYYSDDVDHIIYLPLSTKYLHDNTVHLLPKGGYTRVTITPRISPTASRSFVTFDVLEDGTTEYWGYPEIYTSRCAEDHWHVNVNGNPVFTPGDVFCFKRGVTTALNLVDQEYANQLLNGHLT